MSETPAPNTPSSEPTLQSEAQRLADAARDRAGDAFEEIKVASNQLVDKVRELVEDANVKRVSIRREDKTLFEIPLTVSVGAGAAAVLMTPLLAAVGALAALVSEVTVVIERTDEGRVLDAVSNVADPVASSSAGDSVEDGDGASADKTVGKPPAE
ncbi:MAG: DUF4342 domain-containing protein [Bacteroidota bacterium]